MKRRQFCTGVVATAAGMCGLLPAAASAQSDAWPQRPVRLVVGYGAGGSVDIVARALAQELSKLQAQPSIVDVRMGGGGVIATDYVVNAKDGHTFLFNGSGTYSVKPHVMKLRHDPWRDLKPITLVGMAPYVFVARATLGVKTLGELAAYGKAHPGKLSMALGGIGTINHLASGMFLDEAGVSAVTVPFGGSTPALQSVLAGETDFLMMDPGGAMPYIEDGRIVALAVTTPDRLPFMPDVPTVGESGFPSAEASVLWSLFAPASLPDEVANKMRDAVLEATKSPAFRQVLEARQMILRTTTPEELLDLIRKEEVVYKKSIQMLNLKIE